MKLAIIIPAYNEEKTILSVLKSLPSGIKGISEIVTIVVNDGSEDKTSRLASSIKNATVINLPVNMGVGVATVTGFEIAKKLQADMIITMDADGQHDPRDIAKLIKPIINRQSDIVIGVRLFAGQMPVLRRIGNFLLSLLTWLVYYKWVRDSQSGMKAISISAIEKMDLKSVGFEICSEIIGECQRLHLVVDEIPIRTVYSPYSKKKGQNWLNGINILTKLLSLKIKL
ncbi:MAG: glycosyltransferase family 2 protein [Candidatus Berkelbacteria bacterium]